MSLSKGLDREIRDTFNLTVRAMDSGRPRLASVTNLVVRILGKCRVLGLSYPSVWRCFLIADGLYYGFGAPAGRNWSNHVCGGGESWLPS